MTESARPKGLLDRFSLRARIGILAALVAAVSVVLVSTAAFVTVRASILQALDANLLSRATAAAQSDLADPLALAKVSPALLGAADLRIAFIDARLGFARSVEGQASAPPLGEP